MRIGPRVCGQTVAAYEAVEPRGIHGVSDHAGVFSVLLDQYEHVSKPAAETDGGTEERNQEKDVSHCRCNMAFEVEHFNRANSLIT